MKLDIVTLFPKYFDSPLKESLIAKAQEKKVLKINIIDLRSFSTLPHQQVDDKPYGGGAGMVMRADVLANCVRTLKKENTKVILLDPSGKTLTQDLASSLAKQEHLVIVCGRYEGIDQRFKDKYVDQQISIGDYILNGGEVASLVLLETVFRLIPGAVGNIESVETESFTQRSQGKLLDHPSYTRPEEFEGEKVPQVLLSGNHQEIEKWRQGKSLELTKKLRPDLLK